MISILDPNALALATALVAEGGVIAMPTDTVYGLGCQAWSITGIDRLYQIKNRDLGKSIPILIGDIAQLDLVAGAVPFAAQLLASQLWPGALTLVMPKHARLPETISADQSIGVRLPNHAFTARLLCKTGPMAVTSANRSGAANSTSAEEVVAQIGDKVDLILDGGDTPGALPSTVVSCLTEKPRILRQGLIPATTIQSVLASGGFSLEIGSLQV